MSYTATSRDLSLPSGSQPSWVAQRNFAASAPKAETATQEAAKSQNDDDEFTFSDFIDTVNPLQHIPVLSSLYRAATGEKINNTAQIVGDTVYGGLLGGVTGIATALAGQVIKEETGKTPEEHVLALFQDNAPSATNDPQPTQVAMNDAKPVIAPPPPSNVVDAKDTSIEDTEETEEADDSEQDNETPETELAQQQPTPEKAPEVKTPTAVATSTDTPAIAPAPTGAINRLAKYRANPVDIMPKQVNAAPLPYRPSHTAPVTGTTAAVSPAAVTTANKNASATPNQANPIPPEMVRDMMRMGLEKYAKGLDTGEFTIPSVDLKE